MFAAFGAQVGGVGGSGGPGDDVVDIACHGGGVAAGEGAGHGPQSHEFVEGFAGSVVLGGVRGVRGGQGPDCGAAGHQICQ